MQIPPLKLIVKSRDKTLFDGEVKSITSYNDKGVFDILPLHSNFISLINQKVVIETPDGLKQEIFVDNAILRAVENTVQVFLGISS